MLKHVLIELPENAKGRQLVTGLASAGVKII
jgi:hypothetical protein